jgi:hypothetical protein
VKTRSTPELQSECRDTERPQPLEMVASQVDKPDGGRFAREQPAGPPSPQGSPLAPAAPSPSTATFAVTRYAFSNRSVELLRASESPGTPGNALSPASKSVLRALKSVSSLAWPILKTQSEILGLEPERLLARHIPELLPRLVAAVEQFSTPESGRRLLLLLERSTSLPPPAVAAHASAPDAADSFGAFAQEVRDVLQRFSPLAWPLLEAQASRHQVNAPNLEPQDVARLVDDFEKSLARFVLRSEAREAAQSLRTLARWQRRSRVSMRPRNSQSPGSEPRRSTLVDLPSISEKDLQTSRRR